MTSILDDVAGIAAAWKARVEEEEKIAKFYKRRKGASELLLSVSDEGFDVNTWKTNISGFLAKHNYDEWYFKADRTNPHCKHFPDGQDDQFGLVMKYFGLTREQTRQLIAYNHDIVRDFYHRQYNAEITLKDTAEALLNFSYE